MPLPLSRRAERTGAEGSLGSPVAGASVVVVLTDIGVAVTVEGDLDAGFEEELERVAGLADMTPQCAVDSTPLMRFSADAIAALFTAKWVSTFTWANVNLGSPHAPEQLAEDDIVIVAGLAPQPAIVV